MGSHLLRRYGGWRGLTPIQLYAVRCSQRAFCMCAVHCGVLCGLRAFRVCAVRCAACVYAVGVGRRGPPVAIRSSEWGGGGFGLVLWRGGFLHAKGFLHFAYEGPRPRLSGGGLLGRGVLFVEKGVLQKGGFA